MPSLAVLAFISPIFGLQLDLDPALMATPPLQLETTVAASADPLTVEPSEAPPAATEATMPSPTETAELAAPIAVPAEDIGAQMNRRARLARAHKRLGIATWAALTATVITGTLQYANQYEWTRVDNRRVRCATGDTFLGAEACIGVPRPHVITTATAAALYYTTFGLSFAMPDPIGLDRGNSDSARALRQHKRLRWIHFSGMALQAVLGTFIANPQLMGMDRANDYVALRALATVHLLSGYATYGALTYAGARMAF